MREFVTGQNLGRWRESEAQDDPNSSKWSRKKKFLSKRWMKALAKFPLAILASALLSQTTKHMQVGVESPQRIGLFSSLGLGKSVNVVAKGGNI